MPNPMGGVGHLLSAMGLPVEEISRAAEMLIRLGSEIKAQLDRIESRLANLERMTCERNETRAGNGVDYSDGQRALAAPAWKAGDVDRD